MFEPHESHESHEPHEPGGAGADGARRDEPGAARAAPDERDLAGVYAYACQLFDAGDHARAQRFYQLLALLAPARADHWVALGLTCQRLSEHDDALACFERAASLCGDDPRLAYYTGLSHQLMGATARAQAAFRVALARCAGHPQYETLATSVRRQVEQGLPRRPAPTEVPR
ncbi:CesD/SycD/LcrH family type III secretion system chaperone [Pandoraea oxalativorans]|uniref:CesD/SycD/LcrH family type III secretion system chaperone n=1 Tax=Pandoraea oxalativorans TaxID=573737 RepID=UPI000AF8F0BD|nr:CesD/SycD/LcrH family type III secretion system chaperone [Pandoraea oxalativorans]